MLEDLSNIILILGFFTLSYIIGKIIDAITNRLIERAFFSSFYHIIRRQIKILFTKVKPIKVRLDYNVRMEHFSSIEIFTNKIKTIIKESFELVDQPYYNKLHTQIKQKIRLGTLPYEISVHAIETIENDKKFVENLKLSIISEIEFQRLNDALINMATAVPALNKSFEIVFGSIHLSDGLFTCEITRGELDALKWLDKGKFKLNLLIKTEERINIRIYSNKATISSPNLQITDNTVKYLRELLLNYYL